MKSIFLFLVCAIGSLHAKERDAQKLDFDEVVVKTMSRNPSQLDTVGVIERKGKSKELYEKRTNFSDETKRDLKGLKNAW